MNLRKYVHHTADIESTSLWEAMQLEKQCRSSKQQNSHLESILSQTTQDGFNYQLLFLL